jgi:hypothetical protein
MIRNCSSGSAQAIGGWPTLRAMFCELVQLRVPHPCVLRKGGQRCRPNRRFSKPGTNDQIDVPVTPFNKVPLACNKFLQEHCGNLYHRCHISIITKAFDRRRARGQTGRSTGSPNHGGRPRRRPTFSTAFHRKNSNSCDEQPLLRISKSACSMDARKISQPVLRLLSPWRLGAER